LIVISLRDSKAEWRVVANYHAASTVMNYSLIADERF